MQIQRLSRKHNRQAFDCEVESLNHFLKNVARDETDRDLGVTYVALEDPFTIAGYYTITTTSILGGLFPPPLKLSETRAIGAILLGKLAVDKYKKGQRFGEKLLFQALYDCQKAADIAGALAVVVDALPKAVGFYKKYGFISLTDDENHLFMTMKTIRLLKLQPQFQGEDSLTCP